MQHRVDPRRFLGEFSGQIQRLVPHDRLVLDCLAWLHPVTSVS
jgi:hypothetical protein